MGNNDIFLMPVLNYDVIKIQKKIEEFKNNNKYKEISGIWIFLFVHQNYNFSLTQFCFY